MMTSDASPSNSDKDSAAKKARATRNAIIDSLKRDGPQNANELAKRRKLTPMAVRLHLYDLHEEGLIDFTTEPAKRGRPKKIWSLTSASNRIFPDAHQGLAIEMIASMTSLFGEEGLQKVVDKHADNQKLRYSSALNAVSLDNIKTRLETLVQLRTDEGYMASLDQDNDGFLFIENHCPICSAATSCQRLCSNELNVFQDLFKTIATVERQDHILSGARRCAYRVTPLI
ncbi:helix-turn-helix transcriptional regulator [Hirschia maritima]|uniref:helix-turn-helix transcriptional regulator n=1 Tax=Hirschia maritima TaxID=1121961 RepID=UPI00037ED822|nr:metalloregulator ArsR/SmtB family transcription factor [Hirschia maritima]